ncbi:hypothetical protein BC834DRAFT_373041 [Gloeopeniophorella convolvens]|nr:hypothetical protein BC834DRAFT_373041 [Gloeopeniophorella convolvens]
MRAWMFLGACRAVSPYQPILPEDLRAAQAHGTVCRIHVPLKHSRFSVTAVLPTRALTSDGQSPNTKTVLDIGLESRPALAANLPTRADRLSPSSILLALHLRARHRHHPDGGAARRCAALPSFAETRRTSRGDAGELGEALAASGPESARAVAFPDLALLSTSGGCLCAAVSLSSRIVAAALD